MTGRLALTTAIAALALACGHYAAPVRPPALTPDVGPVYDAGQPPETAEERREQRELERQRSRRGPTTLLPAQPPPPPPAAPTP